VHNDGATWENTMNHAPTLLSLAVLLGTAGNAAAQATHDHKLG